MQRACRAPARSSTYRSGAAIVGLVAILSLGCAGEPSTGPTTAAIRVSVLEFGNLLDRDPDGYTVAIDAGPSRPLRPDTQLTIGDVGVGSHLISLGDVDSNCSVVGTNPRSVEVTATRDAGTGVPVAFAVSCAPNTGTIQVTTTTVGEDQDGDGYIVAIAGQEKGRVQANGTISVDAVREGSWWVSLGDVSPNCKVEGLGAAATVAFGRTSQVALTVQCAPAGSLERLRRIAFVGGSGKNADIYLIYSDGTGETRITTATGAERDPAWSPDGSKLAFASERDGNFEIYSMGSSGENPVRLTQNSADDFRPAWSPDGSRIAFVSNRDGNREIYAMNADGTNQVRLTSDVGSNSDPDWSPDGTRIAFSRQREGFSAIWIMNADGSDARRITSNIGGDDQPAWSPDGSRIAFSHGVNGGSRDIYFVSSDGSSIVLFVSGGGNATDPSWSKDGRKLAFATTQCGAFDWYYDYGCTFSLEIIGVDGTGRLAIAMSNEESNPAYQP